MEVVLIGMGPGPGCLTLQAQQALKGADCLIGSRRLLEECPLPGEVHRFPSTRPGEMVEHLRRHAFRTPCVLFSGDTGFHSGAAPLLPLLKEAGFNWRLIPGVSSPQYLAALLGRSWQLPGSGALPEDVPPRVRWLPLRLGRLALPGCVQETTCWARATQEQTFTPETAAALARRSARLQLLQDYPDAVIESERDFASTTATAAVCRAVFVFCANIAEPRSAPAASG